MNQVPSPFEFLLQSALVEHLSALQLPPKLNVGGTTYLMKENPHCTIAATRRGIAPIIVEREQLSDEAANELAMAEATAAFKITNPHFGGYLPELRIASIPRDSRQTIVIMARGANFEAFFTELSNRLKHELPVQPAHVTIYSIDKRPIGLSSPQELDERSRRLTEPELDEWNRQVDSAKIFGVRLR